MTRGKVNIINRQKRVKIPTGMRMLVRRACVATLQLENINEPCEVDVTFVDDKEIKRLNTEFRNIEASTDVLSFPLGENGCYEINNETGAKMLGDVIISLEHAVSQADMFGHSLDREVAYLTVHSVLHLLGYDHVNGGIEQMRMREKEENVLQELGLVITTEVGE